MDDSDSDDSYADRMVEVHYLGHDRPVRIYPEVDIDDVEVPLTRALAEPGAVYDELRLVPYESRVRIAYSGWPEYLIFVGQAVAGGIAGNAAYDGLKAALAAIHARQSSDQREQPLSRDEAVRLARALLRAWTDAEARGRTTILDTSLFRSGKWVVVLRMRHVFYHVEIPPGSIAGARIRIVLQDGSTALSRMIGRLRSLATRIRYRF